MPSVTNRFFARKAVLAKIESTYGTDAVPTAALNSIEARNVQFTPLDAAYVTNDAEVAYYGQSPEIPVAQAARLQFDVVLQGPGTAGSAWAGGVLLRSAGFAETLLAAPVTGTAQAGGANTITLAVAASSTDNAYKGLRLDLTGGTGSGQGGIVVAYNGTTKIATMSDAWTTQPTGTTTYSIGAQAGYSPVSSGFEALTMYMYLDGVLHKLLGVRSNVSFKVPPKGLPMASFDFVCLYGPVSDTALVTPVLSAFKVPLGVNTVNTSGFSLLGFATNFYDLSFDLGNQVIHRDDVVGLDDVLITDRAPKGSVLIQAPLLAEKDYFTAAKNATLGSVNVTHGTTSGSRFRICVPSTQVKSPKYQNKNGIAALAMDLRPLPVNGNDDFFITFD